MCCADLLPTIAGVSAAESQKLQAQLVCTFSVWASVDGQAVEAFHEEKSKLLSASCDPDWWNAWRQKHVRVMCNAARTARLYDDLLSLIDAGSTRNAADADAESIEKSETWSKYCRRNTSHAERHLHKLRDGQKQAVRKELQQMKKRCEYILEAILAKRKWFDEIEEHRENGGEKVLSREEDVTQPDRVLTLRFEQSIHEWSETVTNLSSDDISALLDVVQPIAKTFGPPLEEGKELWTPERLQKLEKCCDLIDAMQKIRKIRDISFSDPNFILTEEMSEAARELSPALERDLWQMWAVTEPERKRKLPIIHGELEAITFDYHWQVVKLVRELKRSERKVKNESAWKRTKLGWLCSGISRA